MSTATNGQDPAYLEHVRSDVTTIASLVDADALALPVPSCPGWSVRRLVEHVGQVHRMVRCAVVNGRPVAREEREEAPDDAGALATWLLSGLDEMLAVLADPPTGPSTPAPWCFDPQAPDPLAFWRRRQAMENVVHRVDAQQALGLPTVVDRTLAADGVGEVLEVMVRLRLAQGQLTLPQERLLLTASDTGDHWTLGDAGPSSEVVAAAADLFLTLWHRRPVEDLGADPRAERMLRLPLAP